MSLKQLNPHLVLPVGAQVVSRIDVRRLGGTGVYSKGAAPVIVEAPGDNLHAYRVRLPCQGEVWVYLRGPRLTQP